ncbi:hypothetical protein DNTS_018883, partial [Danionella cerebrum]
PVTSAEGHRHAHTLREETILQNYKGQLHSGEKHLDMSRSMIPQSSFRTWLVVGCVCSVFCCRTLALPAIAAYPDIRPGALNEEASDEWTRDPSLQDLEAYKLLYELSNTVERPSRHADGLFTSGYSKLLSQMSAKEYLESLLAKRVSEDLEEMPMKRHSDAVFTDNYSRYRKQMAAKKYLNSVLAGKRRYGQNQR